MHVMKASPAKYAEGLQCRQAPVAATAIIARTVCTVFNEPGDRKSDCGGFMEPISIWVRKNGEWAIIHRCRQCGQLSSNRIAADDNPMKLMSIAMKALALPPFPLEKIEELTDMMAGDGAIK